MEGMDEEEAMDAFADELFEKEVKKMEGTTNDYELELDDNDELELEEGD